MQKNAACPAAEGVGEGDERSLILDDEGWHTDRTLFLYGRGCRRFGMKPSVTPKPFNPATLFLYLFIA
jgi:hypothetical protein